VLPPEAVRVTLLPEHKDEEEGVIDAVRLLLTVTVTELVLMQPANDVPVTL
jgi:hypothetical protein